MNSPALKECVVGEVRFVKFDGVSRELWYQCENGFSFPIPFEDTAGAEWKAKDKAILFMRWIRRWREFLVTAAFGAGE